MFQPTLYLWVKNRKPRQADQFQKSNDQNLLCWPYSCDNENHNITTGLTAT